MQSLQISSTGECLIYTLGKQKELNKIKHSQYLAKKTHFFSFPNRTKANIYSFHIEIKQVDGLEKKNLIESCGLFAEEQYTELGTNKTSLNKSAQ